MKVVRLSALLTGRLYSPGNIPGTHFCQRLSQSQGHSAARRITSMKKLKCNNSGLLILNYYYYYQSELYSPGIAQSVQCLSSALDDPGQSTSETSFSQVLVF